MIVGQYFEGDENDVLKHVQHDVYSEMVWWLYKYAANRYLDDIRYNWEFPDFIPLLRDLKTFDHRVLQGGHDLIAAYYRFLLSPCKNYNLFPEAFDIKAYYLASWKAYFFQELDLLSHREEIAEAIVTAVAYQNTNRGYASEDKLRTLLIQRYETMKLTGAQHEP